MSNCHSCNCKTLPHVEFSYCPTCHEEIENLEELLKDEQGKFAKLAGLVTVMAPEAWAQWRKDYKRSKYYKKQQARALLDT